MIKETSKPNSKNLMLSYLNIYHFVTSCKKSENSNKSMVKKSQKILFLAPFWPKTGQKKFMLSYPNIYHSISSCKKSENFNKSMVRKLQKNPIFGPIWAHFGPKRAKKVTEKKFNAVIS